MCAGYQYDSSTGLYYDANTRFFYDSNAQVTQGLAACSSERELTHYLFHVEWPSSAMDTLLTAGWAGTSMSRCD